MNEGNATRALVQRMKEMSSQYVALVEIEGKCQPRNKNSQQINANDKHTRKLKRWNVRGMFVFVHAVKYALTIERF